MPLEKSAGAVIFRKDPSFAKATKGKKDTVKYLLLHYEAGHWDFPKGNIEKGEDIIDTVKREVEEETGIKKLAIIEGFKETIKYFFKFEEKNILKFVTFFLAETTEKKVNLSFEHIGFKWLPYEQALKQLTYKNAKEIFKKANEFLINQVAHYHNHGCGRE